MNKQVVPIPEGFHSLTPHLVVKGASEAIDFYKNAFGAQEIARMPGPDGKSIIHADLKIGDSHLFLVDEIPAMDCFGPQGNVSSPVTIHLYVEDVDTVFNRALAAGGKVKMPPTDMFWGDRYGVLTDPYGHQWSVATHKADPTPEEMQQGMQEMCKG